MHLKFSLSYNKKKKKSRHEICFNAFSIRKLQYKLLIPLLLKVLPDEKKLMS